MGTENVCITQMNLQREDAKIWISDYVESQDESRSARCVCFGDVTRLITHYVRGMIIIQIMEMDERGTGIE
jgi:hypothetical protein